MDIVVSALAGGVMGGIVAVILTLGLLRRDRRIRRAEGKVHEATPSGTWRAAVGESSVKRFALGAAIGTPATRINSSATGWAGMRRPTVGSPAVTISGIRACFGTTSVRGPGQ